MLHVCIGFYGVVVDLGMCMEMVYPPITEEDHVFHVVLNLNLAVMCRVTYSSVYKCRRRRLGWWTSVVCGQCVYSCGGCV